MVTTLAIVIVTLLILVLQLGRLNSLALHGGAKVSILAEVLIMALPAFIATALPLAALIGWLSVFARYRRDGEWIFLQASGVGLRRLLVPVSITALLAIGCHLLLSHWVVPGTLKQLETLLHNEGLRSVVADLSMEGMTDLGEDVHLFVRQVEQDGRLSHPFLIYEPKSRPGLRQVLWAEQARVTLERGEPVLGLHEGGWQWRNEKESRTATFKRLHLDLMSFTGRTNQPLLFPEWQANSTSRLRQRLQVCMAATSDEAGRDSMAVCMKMAGEVGHRNATAVSIALFAVLSLLFSSVLWHLGSTGVYALAAVIALAYYLLERFGMILAEKAVLPPQIGSWVPVMLLLVILLAGGLRKRKWS